MKTKFEEIYEVQEDFENLIIKKSSAWPDKLVKDFNDKEKVSLSKELALLLNLEISEFIGAVGNYKHHKTTPDGKGPKEVKKEIADMFIFVLNMALTHNMTAEELLNEVIEKQEINFNRQKNGY